MIDLILVPQGAEYKMVCQGLTSIYSNQPLVMAIPVGYLPVMGYLQSNNFQQWQGKNILIMGLAGSLSPQHSIGDVVLYQECFYQNLSGKFDGNLTLSIQEKLKDQVHLVKGLTSNNIIYSAQEKAKLYQKYQADVVDMEGFSILEFSQSLDIKVGMLRVISDDSNHDIPNLSNVIKADGSLDSVQLGISFIKQPIPAFRLIKGSLKGLQVLKKVTQILFN